MTELPPSPLKLFSKAWRTVIAVIVLALCAAAIGWLLAWGAPDNSLHQSALSWSYTLVACILAGIGIGTVMTQFIPALLGKK